MPTPMSGYVGFDSLTKQLETKLLRRGFQFNVMVVGQTGLGKSTMINSLFSAHLMDSMGRNEAEEEVRRTTSIHPVSHMVVENGVKLRLNLVDTPGYGDLIDNEHCWEPIVRYIKDQYSIYLRKELTAVRDRHIPDTRIHAVLFFINPSGHSLRPIDVTMLKKLGDIVNVIPLIAKADSLTLEEREVFKQRIRMSLQENGIRVYPFDHEDYDEEERMFNSQIQAMLPFAVVGSERTVEVNGQLVRGRKDRSGVVNIEDPNHCEFLYLRDMLLRTNTHDLIDTTTHIYYESFRSKQLLALKESSSRQQHQPQAQAQPAVPASAPVGENAIPS